MRTKEECDVVVLGAGVAGLLLASEISRNHKVAVVEKGSDIPFNKYWLTDKESAIMNETLGDAIAAEYSSLDFVAYDETRYRCRGEYVLWDTEALIHKLTKKIEENGGTILTGSTFYGYRTTKESAVSFVNDFSITSKIILDCMGYSSPIIYAKNVVDIVGYYLLYGATFRAKRKIEPVGLHNLVLDKSPGYIEAFPAPGEKVHLILISPESSLKPISSLRSAFDFIINRSPYRHVVEANGDKSEFLGGIIPAGRLRRRALERVYFFGEAGQVNPAATATCLTRMLYTYQKTAKFLSSALQANALSAKDLSDGGKAHLSGFDRRLHLALFLKILRWDSDKFADVVREMIRNDDHELVNQVMFGQLPHDPLSLLSKVKRLVKSRSTNILAAVAGGFTGR